MSAPKGFVGAVLAGGASRRFGRDKTVEPVAGLTLVERGARTLAEVFPVVFVVGGAGLEQPAAWPHIPDLRAGLGPLAGIEAALVHARALGAHGCFVLACDLPLVTADVVQRITGALETHDLAAARKSDDPGFEPLAAVYSHACLPLVRERLDSGDLRVHALLSSVDAVLVDIPPETFLNVNTPADRERAELALAMGDA